MASKKGIYYFDKSNNIQGPLGRAEWDNVINGLEADCLFWLGDPPRIGTMRLFHEYRPNEYDELDFDLASVRLAALQLLRAVESILRCESGNRNDAEDNDQLVLNNLYRFKCAIDRWVIANQSLDNAIRLDQRLGEFASSARDRVDKIAENLERVLDRFEEEKIDDQELIKMATAYIEQVSDVDVVRYYRGMAYLRMRQ